MNVSRSAARAPSGPLAEHVELLWLTCACNAPSRELLIPSVSFEIVLTLREGPVKLCGVDGETAAATDGAVVSGLRQRATVVRPDPAQCTMGVRFRPGGAHAVLRIDASEFADQHVPLRELWGPEVQSLRDRLFCAASDAQRFAILESYLTRRLLKGGPDCEPGVGFALCAFDTPAGRHRVVTIADEIGWSARQFSNRFARRVGLTPKRYCRLRRFQHAIDLRATAPSGWADIAQSAGYSDQAHLCHEFRRFAGLTPGDYAKRVGKHPHLVILND